MYRIQGPKRITVFVTNRSSCCQSCGAFSKESKKENKKNVVFIGSSSFIFFESRGMVSRVATKKWSLLVSFFHLLVYSFILLPIQRLDNRIQAYMISGVEGTEMSRDCSDCSPVNGKAEWRRSHRGNTTTSAYLGERGGITQ